MEPFLESAHQKLSGFLVFGISESTFEIFIRGVSPIREYGPHSAAQFARKSHPGILPGVPVLIPAGEPHLQNFLLGLYNEPARFVKTFEQRMVKPIFTAFQNFGPLRRRLRRRSADAALSGAVAKGNIETILVWR